MSIRFCEFCSTVHPDGSTHCPDCGARLTQSVSEEQFNDPGNPWPFAPVSCICLRIQGQPRNIRFSGTHSVFHLWSALNEQFDRMSLYCRVKHDELELVGFPQDQCPADYTLLDPAMILNNRYKKFSFYTYMDPNPEVPSLSGGLDRAYHGSFEICDCPADALGNVLGFLVGTKPRPSPDNGWTYDI